MWSYEDGAPDHRDSSTCLRQELYNPGWRGRAARSGAPRTVYESDSDRWS